MQSVHILRSCFFSYLQSLVNAGQEEDDVKGQDVPFKFHA